jgi:hypothetical protein
MSVPVVIVRHGSNRVLHEWDEEEMAASLEDHWLQAASLWPAEFREGFTELPDVFLCLDQETLADYATDSLLRVIRKAHRSLWGANVYVVVDKRRPVEEAEDLHPIRENWFHALLENGVSDVLELTLGPKIDFYSAATRAAERLDAVREHIPSGRWICLLDPPLAVFSPSTRLFLENFLPAAHEKPGNRLIVLRECTDSRIGFVRSSLVESPPGTVMVGLLDTAGQSTHPSLQELRDLCRDHSSRLMRFHGTFELHYFLQRLNAVHERHRSMLEHAEIISVQNGLFSRYAPQLLITDDSAGAFSAADDVHSLRLGMPDGFEIVVHPAMQNNGFRETLSRLKQLFVWVHIGHGDGVNGLQQADGLYKRPEEWISCMARQDKSLSLAVFASCKSDIMAREFARAGASVTIGFKRGVQKRLSGEMSAQVVKAAFESSGNRDRILDAFRRLKGMLADAEPVIFFAKH